MFVDFFLEIYQESAILHLNDFYVLAIRVNRYNFDIYDFDIGTIALHNLVEL